MYHFLDFTPVVVKFIEHFQDLSTIENVIVGKTKILAITSMFLSEK